VFPLLGAAGHPRFAPGGGHQRCVAACRAIAQRVECSRLQKRSSEQDSQILVIADEGKEEELRRIARRSKVWNPIGSQFGTWGDGSSWKNIPNDRLIEDPFFKPSHQSYFLQAADFVSFALLKSEVAPTAHVAKYGLDKVYVDLAPVCAKEASRKDPRGLGIVRT